MASHALGSLISCIACRAIGHSAASFELDDSPLENFLSGIGFMAGKDEVYSLEII